MRKEKFNVLMNFLLHSGHFGDLNGETPEKRRRPNSLGSFVRVGDELNLRPAVHEEDGGVFTAGRVAVRPVDHAVQRRSTRAGKAEQIRHMVERTRHCNIERQLSSSTFSLA